MDFQLTLIGLVLVVIVLVFSAVIQSAVGFAFGMFAIAPLVWLGMGLPHAIATVVAAVLIQTTWASYNLRSDIKWSVATPAVFVRNVAMPLGTLALLGMTQLDPRRSDH